MIDIRAQLPECPLEYEVPDIPATHTALVIPCSPTEIAWQQKMLPWTLASLINNTDIVLKGVHLFIHCDDETAAPIRAALRLFDLPDRTIVRCTSPVLETPLYQQYDKVCILDPNYWAFRGPNYKGEPTIKLPLGFMLQHNWAYGLAEYSLHAANNIMLKNEWVRTDFRGLRLTNPDAEAAKATLATHLMEAGTRARWLHAANIAVYGENYEKQGENVARYFFNDSDPNWHLDASIFCIASGAIPKFRDWCKLWEAKIGTAACIALHLLKSGQHAYNFKDSLMIEDSTPWNQIPLGTTPYFPKYPRLCNMKDATKSGFVHAIHHLMAAQMGVSVTSGQ